MLFSKYSYYFSWTMKEGGQGCHLWHNYSVANHLQEHKSISNPLNFQFEKQLVSIHWVICFKSFNPSIKWVSKTASSPDDPESWITLHKIAVERVTGNKDTSEPMVSTVWKQASKHCWIESFYQLNQGFHFILGLNDLKQITQCIDTSCFSNWKFKGLLILLCSCNLSHI
jgi:hypothetical protein